ncbi:MAG: hypothetical protein OXG09_11365 [Chloroflexi bacterium]|nr:hypothetical protein [Chloroflexota bacterium]
MNERLAAGSIRSTPPPPNFWNPTIELSGTAGNRPVTIAYFISNRPIDNNSLDAGTRCVSRYTYHPIQQASRT